MLHGCTIGEGSLIGIRAVVLNRAVIGKNCTVGAGAVVTEGKAFPDRSLILGAPAKAVRELNDRSSQPVPQRGDLRRAPGHVQDAAQAPRLSRGRAPNPTRLTEE